MNLSVYQVPECRYDRYLRPKGPANIPGQMLRAKRNSRLWKYLPQSCKLSIVAINDESLWHWRRV
jgi:hypothetical protein